MKTVLSTFWKGMVYAMKITGPLVRVLRLVDGEKRPPMGYIYEAMDKAKEAMKEALGGQRNERSMQEQLVHEEDDLTWDQVAEALGANERRVRLTRSRLQSLQRGVDDEPQLDETESDGEEQYIEEADKNDSDEGEDEIEDEALLNLILE
ncbi:hypothetical protein HHK36_008277 [Tetracentron sinense]|uniref:Uncharacterized protein n=1 Tax=Tetracentron sinense TaxID=13715 RepID=A0A834ZG28_TETSI|nr:hypothetical protein HHK36_008277 [Tetracentron sinense]